MKDSHEGQHHVVFVDRAAQPPTWWVEPRAIEYHECG